MNITTTTPNTIGKAAQILISGLLLAFLAVMMSATPASAGEPPEPTVEPGWTGTQLLSTCAKHTGALVHYPTAPDQPSKIACVDNDFETIFMCLKLRSDRTWLCFPPRSDEPMVTANESPTQVGEMLAPETTTAPTLSDASHIIIMNGVATEMAEHDASNRAK